MSAARLNLVQLGCLLFIALAACTSQVFEPARPTDDIRETTAPALQPLATTQESILEGIITTSTTPEQPLTSPTYYDFEVELDYDAKTLAVSQTITYTNNIGQRITELPILVPPAYRDGVFLLGTIQIQPLRLKNNPIFVDFSIDLILDPSLEPGEEIRIHLNYQLRLPMSYDALGYTDRQLLLTDWYPLIPPYQEDGGWLINPPGLVGEHLVYPLSNFHLDLCLAPSRDDLIVAASVPVTDRQSGCYQYKTQNKRNISLAISPHYQVASTASDLVTVIAYTFSEHALLGQRAAKLAIEAWNSYDEMFGPNDREFLAIVEADIYDGLETDGLILLSEWYFQTADPSPQNYFTLLIVHETAHQWFYAHGHNDQANEPWLDEALATYSELLFFERHHPQLVNWWWDFRVNTYAPAGPVNTTIYEFNHYRPYINAVYLRGAAFLQALRSEVGDPDFYLGLQQYLQPDQTLDNFRSSEDFFEAFSQVSDADLTLLIAEYFQ